MANTVPVLSFTNTFGDLLAQQNRAAIELNNIAANNYTKDSGTLFLNGAGTGLQVTAAALLGSGVVSGTLSVGQDITALSNVFVNGAGFALDVANNANIRQNTITNNLTANNIVRTTTVNASGNVFANDISSNNLIRTTTLNAQGNVFVNNLQSNGAIFGASANIVGRIITNSLVSNTSIDGSTLIISNLSTTNDLTSNNLIRTTTLNVSTNTFTGNLVANNSIRANTLIISANAIANEFTTNNNIRTTSLSASNFVVANDVTGNTTIRTVTGFIDNLQSNNSVNTAIVTAADRIIGRNIQANTGLSAANLVITGAGFVGSLIANSTITVPTLTLTTKLDANGAAESYFNNIQTLGQLAVGGNFIINGSTVYNTNTFTINAGSSTGQVASFNVNRGFTGANASIRWNEPQDYWDILNVNNSTYYRILTDEYFVDNLLSTSTNSVATANVANTLNNLINTSVINLQNQIAANVSLIAGVDADQNTTITAVNNYAATGFARANTSANTFIGTSGSANATSGVTTFTSTNGITITGSANTLTFNTPQDVRTTASPTFNGLTLTNALAISQGGTSATSSAAALTNLLPSASGVPAGYVLATNGPGTYYWAAGGTGGGGGAVPGTTIQSTRLTYTANGAGLSYTTPTYIPGASQLRVYFDGVRQFASAYTETSNTIVTFGTSPASGTVILVEVDGYINNPYFANNITFTAPFGGITSTANTIQLAIQDLETRKAALSSAAFTGQVTGITIDTNAANTSFTTAAFVKNALNSGNTFSMSVSGNAGTVTNGVYTTGNQTIGGVKTFSSTISGSIDGNAGTVTNGVVTTGSYANPSFITSLANAKITGLAASATTDTTNAGNISSGTLPSGRLTGTYAIGISGTAASATLATKASTLAQNGGNGTAMTFNWSGQSGQPTWLWGSNDGVNHYVYNPSNFSVNFATSAGSASTATSPASGGSFITTSNIGSQSVANATNVTNAIGNGQSWQNLTGSRSVGTTYTNSTGKPIFVSVIMQQSGGSTPTDALFVEGTVVSKQTHVILGDSQTLSAIVPNGSQYFMLTVANTIIEQWLELR